MLCPYCATETDDTSIQCPRCGTVLRSAPPPEPVSGYPSSPISPHFELPVPQYSTDYAAGQPPATYQPSAGAYPQPPTYYPYPYPAEPQSAPPMGPLSVPPMAPPPEPRRRVSPVWWLTGAVLVLALAVLATQLPIFHKSAAQPGQTAGPTHPGPPTSTSVLPTATTPAPTTADAAYPQAQAVNGILTLTSSSRASLGSALNDLGNCVGLDSAVGILQRVVGERTDQASRARQLDVPDLPNGDLIKNTLVEALSDSLQADNAYLSWGRDEQVNGCGNDQNKQAGDQASLLATGAKQRFVATWNPVAVHYGLPTRVETDV
jgi:hypothetical protein